MFGWFFGWGEVWGEAWLVYALGFWGGRGMRVVLALFLAAFVAFPNFLLRRRCLLLACCLAAPSLFFVSNCTCID